MQRHRRRTRPGNRVGYWQRLTLIALPPMLVCASLSWNFVDQPILSRKTTILAAVDRA